MRSTKKIPAANIDSQLDSGYDEAGEYEAREKAKKKRFRSTKATL